MIKVRIHFIIGIIVSIFLFLIFSNKYESYYNDNVLKKLNEEAKVLEHYIWGFDENGAVKYLKLASRYGRYKHIKIKEITGDYFINADFYKLNSIENFLNNIKMLNLNRVEIPIVHNNKKLSTMEVYYYKDTVYIYALYLIFNIFLLIIYLFMIYLIKVKGSLEFTVSNRTKELASREKMLTESNEKLRITINSIGDIFILTDSDGYIDYVNPIGEEILNYTLKELKGKKFKDIFNFILSKNDNKQIYPLDKVLENGVSISHEEPILFKGRDNKLIHVLDKSTPIYDFQKNIIGSVIILKDITKIYQLLEELRQSQKMESIGQLSGGIAHDFNNMLAGILGATEMLLLEENIPQNYKENLEVILKSSQKASHLTRKLLDFSRKGGIYKEVLDTEKEILETIELLKRSIDKKIKIKTSFNAKNKYIKIDSSQFQNAVINLIVNSKDAIGKKPIIEVETSDFYINKDFCDKSLFNIIPGDYFCISIKDNGKGISSDIKERIFEPFFTTKEVGKGTGLGLAAVYGTVVDYRGFLDVDSDIGKGTCISLYFPVVKGYKNIKKDKIKSDDNYIYTGNILLVDDEDGVRYIASKMLKKIGFNVFEAENGREAVEIFEKNKDKISLVLMDIVMPEMDGREAFYKLKEIDKDIKVILLSGYTREARIELLIKEGVKGFLLKPYTIKALKNKISEVLG